MSAGKKLIRDIKETFTRDEIINLLTQVVDFIDAGTISKADSLADKYGIKEVLKCPHCKTGLDVCFVSVGKYDGLTAYTRVKCCACRTSGPQKPSQAEAEQAWRDLFQRGD